VNNSNTAVLHFSVENKEQLKIAQVRNFPNPFKTLGGKTTFAFEHNQPNTDLRVQIDIVDASGAAVIQIKKTINTQGTRNIEVLWDGTTKEGRKATPGVYYYRFKVTTAENSLLAFVIFAGQLIIN